MIADPATPSEPARTIRYPAAGTDNAIVTLHVLGLDGSRVDVDWDRESFPYIATVDWTDAGLLMLVQSRDQRSTMLLRVDPDTGETAVARRRATTTPGSTSCPVSRRSCRTAAS